MSSLRDDLGCRRPDRPARVGQSVATAGRERGVPEPAHECLELADRGRRLVDAGEQAAAAEVDVVAEADRDRQRGGGLGEGAVVGVDGRDPRRDPGRQRENLVAGAKAATVDPARVRAIVRVAGGAANHPLDRQAERAGSLDRVDADGLEVLEERRPVEPGHGIRRLDDVVAAQRRDRDGRDAGDAEAPGKGGDLGGDRPEHGLVESDEVHLVDRDDQLRDAEQGGDRDVPPGLLEDPGAGVDEDDREVGCRAARDHVAGVLEVPRRVGDDELAARCLEVAIGNVDRDPLLALGAEAVGQQGEIEPVAAAASRGVLERDQLVVEDALRVVEQAPDQRALAVVDRPRCREPKEVGRRVRPMDGPGRRRDRHQK